MKIGDKVKFVGNTVCMNPRYDCKVKEGVIKDKDPSSSPDKTIWKVEFRGDVGIHFIFQEYLEIVDPQGQFSFTE
jgi:hypothetical protein